MQVVHQSRPVVPRDRLVRLPEVEGMTGCKKSTIYELMRAGKFPKSIRLNARMVAWPESAVLTWVQERIAEAMSAEPTPMQKALAASRETARRLLLQAVSWLSERDDADVFFSARMPGKGAPRVVFAWTGNLMLIEHEGGEIIREAPAATMALEMPEAAAFMAQQRPGKPLYAFTFKTVHGQRVVHASVWPDGALRVHGRGGYRMGKLLAESEPGEFTALAASFHPLTPQDLAPRIH